MKSPIKRWLCVSRVLVAIHSIATAVIARTTQMEESKQEIEVEEVPQIVVTHQQKA